MAVQTPLRVTGCTHMGPTGDAWHGAASIARDTCSPLVPLRLSLRSSLFSSFWLLLVTLHMDICTSRAC